MIELERLETAVRIEKERSIVFPETTVIIRDIQKLTAAINSKAINGNPAVTTETRERANDRGGSDEWGDLKEL